MIPHTARCAPPIPSSFARPQDCNNQPSQQWFGGGAYQYKNKANDNKCLDLFGADATNGKRLEVWDCAPPPPTPAPPPTPKFNQEWLGPSQASQQTIVFKSSCDSSAQNCKKCFDLSNNGDTTNGNKIEIWVSVRRSRRRIGARRRV